MNQIAEIQASKFACFNHLTPEVKNEQIKSLFYIERMAGVSNTDISKIDIFDVFGSKTSDKALLVTAKGEINKRLMTVAQTPTVEQAQTMSDAHMASITAMNAAFMTRQTERLESLRYEKRSSLSQVDNHFNRANEYLRQAWIKEIEIQRITGHTPNFETEFKKIVSTGFWEFLEIKDNLVYFVTKSPIVLTHKNKMAGVEIQVAMGRYKACYDARNNLVTLLSHERNPRARNAYWHPYVNTAGQICFGNAASQASKHLSALEIGEYFSLLSALLVTYSPDSTPYTSLENFKEAFDKGWFEYRKPCQGCGEPEGTCGCHHCPKCNDSYRRDRCSSHWCPHCETYNRYDCNCCQGCGTTTYADKQSHEDHCSEYEAPEQVATQITETVSSESDDDGEEELEF